MSTSSPIALAYCADDQLFAERLEADLRGVADFVHFSAADGNDSSPLSEQLRDFSGRVLLLISDNFLRNPNCMFQANQLLTSRSGGSKSTQAILLDVVRYDEQIGESVQVPARISRQSDIMVYINHWQKRYLDLRRQRAALAEEIGPSFEVYLNKIKEISGRVNDFMHYLKDSMPLRLHEFSANRYQQFFIFVEDEAAWNDFQLPAQTGASQDFANTQDPATSEVPATDEPEVELPELPAYEEPVLETEQPQDSAPTQEATEDEELQHPASPENTATSEVPDIEEEQLPELPEYEEPELPEPDTATTPTNDKHNGGDINALIQRVWGLVDEGDWPTGLDLFKNGRKNYPDNHDLVYHHALLLATEADQPAAARKETDYLLSVHPEHLDGLFLSGELAFATGDYQQAREKWEQLSDLDAKYTDLNQELGLLLAEHFPDDRAAATEYLKAAHAEGSVEAAVYYHYGKLLTQEMQKPAKAMKMLKRAVELDPDHAQAHYELAVLQHEAGHYKLALGSYHRASELEPAYHTPENEKAFASPAKQKPRLMTENEAGALSALKENIAQLEGLLQEREAAAMEAQQLAETAALESRVGHGKTVLISGATSGIGLATARQLAGEGYRLILTGRRGDRLAAVAEEVAEAGPTEVTTLNFDLRDRSATQSAIEGLAEEWGSIDILINNAGKAKGFDPIHAGKFEHWEEMIDVNLKGLLYLTRAVTPGMVDRKSGFVINICSTAGKEIYPKGNVYCATKHAVDALTRAMRVDLVEYGIRVGQVCPAHVEETEFAEVRFDGDKERAAKVYEDFQPLLAADVAETISFMLSRPAHVNVQDVVLQGQQQASSNLINRSGRSSVSND